MSEKNLDIESSLKSEQIESLVKKANKSVIGDLSSKAMNLSIGNRLSRLSSDVDASEAYTPASLIPSQKSISRLINPRSPIEIEEALKSIDKKRLKELKGQLRDFDLSIKSSRYPDEGQLVDADDLKENIEDALSKFISCIEEFEDFNSQHARSLSLKAAEYELEHQNMKNKLELQDAEAKLKAQYDWKEKWRHLFIKSLGTILFIGILLVVGSLVNKYDWLHLPYSSLFKSIPLP